MRMLKYIGSHVSRILVALWFVAACDGSSGSEEIDAAIACEATPAGCECGPPDVFRDEVAECSVSSVVTTPGTVGYCCDSLGCECMALGCFYHSNIDYCACGPEGVVGNPNAVVVASCTSGVNVHCCRGPSFCTCSVDECSSVADEVPGCFASDFASCAGGMQVNDCR